MSLRDEPDLPLWIREHEIALARLRWVVHAEHLVDVAVVKVRVTQRIGNGRVLAGKGADLHVQPVGDVHGSSIEPAHSPPRLRVKRACRTQRRARCETPAGPYTDGPACGIRRRWS